MKEPDKFLSTSEKVTLFLTQNQNTVIALVVAALVLLGGITGFRYYQKSQALKMESLYFQMQKISDRLQESEAPETQEGLGQMKALLDQFGSGSQKLRAQLLLADTYYREHQYEEAIAGYSQVQESAPENSLYRSMAQAGRAYALEAQKNYPEAIEAYKSLIQNGHDYPLFDVYLSLARCYELADDYKNALLILREMENKFPGHAQMSQVERRIQRLSARV